MNILQTPSPNFGDRKGDGVDMLVLHYTDLPSGQEALTLMQDPAHEAAAHYMVDDDGTIHQLVEEDRRAWHAGTSYWQGETDINSCSIGIEIQNPGHQHGLAPFPEAQISSLAALCQDIFSRHQIPAARVLGHSDVAPERKKDPGELFPWARLAKNGIGLWPDPTLEDQVALDHIVGDEMRQRSLFKELGYDTSGAFTNLVTAFQRHWQPEVFGTPEEGQVGEETIIRLKALVRQAA